MTSSKRNNFLPYLALTAGVGCTATHTDAAVVTFYGPGAQSPSTTPATPAGFDIYFNAGSGGGFVDPTFLGDTRFAYESGAGYFTQGTNQASTVATLYAAGSYHNGTIFHAGAQAGNLNYANISLTGEITGVVYEAVAQFSFDGAGNGYLVAIAANETEVPMTISEGKALIDAVPEPSSLALLALGAGGLTARRKRRKENAA